MRQLPIECVCVCVPVECVCMSCVCELGSMTHHVFLMIILFYVNPNSVTHMVEQEESPSTSYRSFQSQKQPSWMLGLLHLRWASSLRFPSEGSTHLLSSMFQITGNITWTVPSGVRTGNTTQCLIWSITTGREGVAEIESSSRVTSTSLYRYHHFNDKKSGLGKYQCQISHHFRLKLY